MFTSQKNTVGNDQAEKGEQSGGGIVIHAMPKRFITSQPAAGKARGTGIMILLTGAVILGVAGVLLYFYYTNPDQLLNTDNNYGANENPVTGENSGGITGAGGEEPGQNPAAADTGNEIVDATGADSGNPETAENRGGDMPEPTIDGSGSSAASGTVIDYSAGDQITDGGAATGSPAEATSTPSASVYKAAPDSDGDGLSDAEEAALGSDANLRDSDGDGYDDLVETMNLYNPAGTGGLLANDKIEQYTNGDYGYHLLYPRAWTVERIGGGDSVIFTIGNSQFIQVIIQPNAGKQPIEDWYKEQVGANFLPSGQIVYKNGWLGVRSEDGLTAYLTKPGGDRIFIMSYNPGVNDILSYNDLFAIMIKSLELSA